MWKKKLQAKKMQYLVIGVILAFATMILSTCISFSNEVYDYIDAEYDNPDNASLYIKATSGTAKHIEDASKSRSDIDRIETLTEYELANLPLYHNEDLLTDLSNDITILVMKDYTESSLSLTPMKGDTSSKGPKKGEVWIQSLFSNIFDVSVGDEFTLKDYSFKVSTVVNDIRKPVSMTNGYTIFINEADLEHFSSLESFDYILLSSKTKEETLLTWLDSIYTNEYRATENDTLSGLKLKASLMTILVSGLGSLAAGLMLILTIVIILFFIRNTIQSEYRAIGTYKSCGYSSRQIKGFYLKSYALVGGIAITIGALLGLPVSRYIGQIALEYVGKYHLSSVSIVTTIIIILGTFLLVVASVYLALHRISKITPVAALRMGLTNTKAKIKRSLIKQAHSSFTMSINDIWKHKGSSAIILLIITLSFYIAIVLPNMLFSFNHMDENASKWVSLPDCDLYVRTTDTYVTDEFLDFIENNPYVESHVVGDISSNVVLQNDDSKLNLNYAMITNLDNFDSSLTHVTYAQGRPPKNGNEIAIDDVTLLDTGYKLGDTIDIELEGVKKSVMICGIYDTMLSPSVSFYSKAFEEMGIAPEKYYNHVMVRLKNPDDIEAFKQSVLDQYPTYTFTTMSNMIESIKDSIISIMVPITILLIVVFFTFVLLNITNMITMNNNKQRHDFGIMKAFGFSTGYIIRRNTFRIGILAVLGLLISLLLDYKLTGTFFYQTLGVPAYSVYPAPTFALLAGGVVIVIVLTILLSLSIRKITPKNLMEE